jgi:hypothetical protein
MVVVAALSARKVIMAITLMTFVQSVVGSYLLGMATVLAILVWIFDRNHHEDALQDHVDKVFILRFIMWLPLIGAGLMIFRVVQSFYG